MEAIYVRFADTEELEKISRSLNEFYKDKKPPPVSDLTSGDVYLLSSGEKFFRAQVLISIIGEFHTF